MPDVDTSNDGGCFVNYDDGHNVNMLMIMTTPMIMTIIVTGIMTMPDDVNNNDSYV